jgi:ferric-dicitrate binding protein FerR (iron transport regulator)
MSENIENNLFLADWISGKITDEQLRQLVSQSDFIGYQKLKLASDFFEVTPSNMEANFEAIQRKIDAKRKLKHTKVLALYGSLSAAAVLMLFFGLYQILVFSNEIRTSFGEKNSITLEDRSKVIVGAKSRILYPNLFKYHRVLRLEGEAFFEVEKGGSFVVDTKEGEVTVLGTKFNVIARPDFLEVACFEGKVAVFKSNAREIITQGQAIRFYGNKLDRWVIEDEQKPLWLSGESSYRQLPLKYVIDLLERQYHYQIDYPKSAAQTKISGSFTHKDIDVALQTICVPLQLHYTKSDSRKIIISE